MSVVHPDVDLTVNLIRLHDQAVRMWALKLGTYMGGPQKFNVIFASPERAFGTLSQVLQGAYGDRAEQLRVAPYPYLSIHRSSIRFAADRYLYSSRKFRTSVYTADKRVSFVHPWPLAVDIDYQLDFWAKRVDSADPFAVWFQSETIPEGSLTIDFTQFWAPLGQKLVFMTSAGITDNTNVEAEGEQRVVRLTGPITVRGWIVLPPVAERTVFEVLTDYQFC